MNNKTAGGEKPQANHKNTQAPMTKTIPGGKPHAKVTTVTPTQVGKYL